MYEWDKKKVMDHYPKIEWCKLNGTNQNKKLCKFNKTKGILRKTDIQVQLINNI